MNALQLQSDAARASSWPGGIAYGDCVDLLDGPAGAEAGIIDPVRRGRRPPCQRKRKTPRPVGAAPRRLHATRRPTTAGLRGWGGAKSTRRSVRRSRGGRCDQGRGAARGGTLRGSCRFSRLPGSGCAGSAVLTATVSSTAVAARSLLGRNQRVTTNAAVTSTAVSPASITRARSLSFALP